MTNVTVRIFGNDKRESLAAPDYVTATVSPSLLAQVVHSFWKRTRIRRANTKDRSEVRGGGRKPWKQKGTGRSRHGSIRSPIWRGGGITFGPRARKERIVPIPLMMRRRALAGALSQQAEKGALEIIRLPPAPPAKTKDMVSGLWGKKAQETGGHVLLVLSDDHRGFARAARNIAALRIKTARQVNVQDIISARTVWLDEASLPLLQQRTSLE